MESCLKFVPRKSYPWYGWLSLILFVSIGVFIIGITSVFESKATLKCNLDETIASDLSRWKYVETQCFLKYVEEFYPFLPPHIMFIINFGIVLVFSIIYAYIVKGRVEVFAEPPLETVNGDEEERQPLRGNMSPAALDPMAHTGSNRYFVFTVYVLHLIFGRVLPLMVFTVLLLKAMNYPLQFDCCWPIMSSMSTINVNVTRSQINNFKTVDCTYPFGSTNEPVVAAAIAINFIFATETIFEVVYLLWSSWKDCSFMSDLEFCCVYILRKRKRIRKVMKKIRANVCEDEFNLHDDFGGKRLSQRKLEEIYVNVTIQDGRESTWMRTKLFKNRLEVYDAHIKPPVDITTLETTANLFEPCKKEDSQKYPRTILIVGRPGIGKTLLTKKIFHEWKQESSEFWYDKIVLLIQFRAFKQSKISLREMLKYAEGLNMSSAHFNCIYEHICVMPSKAILIFDGLDELKNDSKYLAEKMKANSHNEVAHILQIFKQLVRGKLLPGVTVLTTSRPTAEHIYLPLSFDKEVEIMGFQEEQIKDYVKKFCSHDVDTSIKMWNFIKEYPEILSLCYIPVNCYIICLTLKESINSNNQEVPRTITKLYKRAIKILLFRHHTKYKCEEIPKNYIISELPQHFQIVLKTLKEIAQDGMKNDQLIFELKNEDKCMAELSDCGIINKLDDKQCDIFCFLHLTIQEFLAAQHIVDNMENVELFLIDHIKNPKWHLVIQFVAGLIGDKIRDLKEQRNSSERSAEFARDQETIRCICERFQEWIGQWGEISEHKTLLAIKCVLEMQDVRLMEYITSYARGDNDEQHLNEFCLNNLNIAPVECTALFKYFDYTKNLRMLKIKECSVENFVAVKLAELLKKNNQIVGLELENCRISVEDAKHIISALRNENCKVTQLAMSGNRLSVECVQYLSDTIATENCKLVELVMRDRLVDECAKYLCNALRNDNCKLTQLDISDNQLTCVGAKCLSDVLESGSCKLARLNIGNNNLENLGAKCLSEGLKNDNCILTELFINGNKLTDEGVKCLCDALVSDECKLTKLHLSKNELTDVGAKYLSDAVMSKNCKLVQLDITSNGFTDMVAKYLGDALKSENCKIRELYINGSNLANVKVKDICDALKSGNCKITELDVKHNQLTDDDAKYLTDSLKSENCNLVKVDISHNYLTDVAAKYFFDAMKNENCKLTELRINNNYLTEEGTIYLTDAVYSDKCKLRKLIICSG